MMKISRAKLKKLIESYLYEQEEEEMDGEEESPEGSDSETEDEPADTEDEMDADGEEDEEDTGVKWDEAGFQIEVDGTEKDISFYEDEQTGKVNYKVDGDKLSRRTTANFATIGNLATLSAEQIFFFVSSRISTKGNLTVGLHIPSKEAAYLTGDGLLSINNDL